MMTSILLNTSFFSAHSVMLIWIGGGILFLLLCYGIFRQWRTGKRLRKELIEIEKIRQNNIEYDFVLKAMKENYGPMFEKRITAEDMAHFRKIIEDEKMYKYKESYRPMMEVLDGWGWSFHAKFSDGSWIDSHGSNARPNGNGLGRIEGYMNQLIQDGVQIEFLPDED